jgi:hypothetical protein
MKARSAMLAVLLLSGCYETSSGPAPTIFGRYSLHSVDGLRPPATMTEIPNLKLEIMTGMITLNSDNTFTDSTEMRRTDGAVARRYSDVAHGSFVHAGESIALSSSRGEHYSMAIEGRSLTQNLSGTILVYRR